MDLDSYVLLGFLCPTTLPDTLLLLWPLVMLLPWVFVLCHIPVIVPRFHAWLLLVLLRSYLWSYLWLGPSISPELPILLLLHGHSLRVDLALMSPNFISTFPYVGLERPSRFRRVSFRHLERLEQDVPPSYHIRCCTDYFIIL